MLPVLILLSSFHDIGLAMRNFKAGQLSLDLFKAPASSEISQDRLFEEARVCLPKIYGSRYPVEEYMDDIENYRALHFNNRCQRLKLNVMSLGIAARNGPVDRIMVKLLEDQIHRLGLV